MRLLKFVYGDAPQTGKGLKFDNVTMILTSGSKTWTGQDSSSGSSTTLTGCYWLVADNGSISAINDVVLMKPSQPYAKTTSKGDSVKTGNRLLKFIDGDAPQSAAGMKFDGAKTILSFGSGSPKKWVGQEHNASNSGLFGCYLLVGDTGAISIINDVVLMKLELTLMGSTPKGVEDRHIEGVDFRNKIGRALESSRADYGVTYKKSSAKPSLMNQQEKYEKRQEAMKKEREDVANQIANGEVPISKKSRKEAEASAAANTAVQENQE